MIQNETYSSTLTFVVKMYNHYFGFSEKPFAIAPNPRFLFMSDHHREALAHLLYGVTSHGCIILLTGDVGTGKTTVCRSLLKQLPESTEVAYIVNPRFSILELLQTICEELNIAVDNEQMSYKAYVDSLNRYLLDTHSQGQNTVLIIDEAQNLTPEILEQLRLLTNLETDTKKLLQIILIGQPELLKTIKSPKLKQLNQRITTRYHLNALKPEEVNSYINYRISVVATRRPDDIISKSAIRYISKKSHGIPRLINLLCDHSLLGAYVENKEFVSKGIVKKALPEVITPDKSLSTIFPKKSLGSSLLVALFVFSILVLLYSRGMLPLDFPNKLLH